jgi:hypothetical protein
MPLKLQTLDVFYEGLLVNVFKKYLRKEFYGSVTY